MADINLDGLSLSEAEEAIAEIWSCLEEYDIPSPVVKVGAGANSGITMGFSFEEPIWAEVVTLRLSNLMRGTARGWRCSTLAAKEKWRGAASAADLRATIYFLHVAAEPPPGSRRPRGRPCGERSVDSEVGAIRAAVFGRAGGNTRRR